MKVALIADTFPPLRTSGAVQLRDLAREFARQGHELTVLLPDADLDRPWTLENFDGAQVLRLRSPRTKDISYIRRTIGEWLMPRAMWRNLRRSPLAGQCWDGIVWYSPSIFHGPLVRALKRQSGCKGYLIIRDIFPEWAVDLGVLRPGPVYRFLKWIARQQYDVADIIGVQTPGNLGYFEQWREARKGRSLEVLQNWLDAPASARCPIRIEETPLAGRKIMVYAGNMGIAQGMDILLDLADRMQVREDIGFLFVGRGRDAKRLRETARARRLDNVLFRDEIDPDEIPDLYAQCDVGIVALDPRHKSHNIPGKFLTYMQNGLPVLANVNPGNDLAPLIKRENVGGVCENNSLDELEQRCLALIKRIDADPKLPVRCFHLFQRQFSVSHTVQQVISSLCARE
ncbi:glycosyltransferase WbuB [Thioclava sp. DLFJ5-1]|uniref:glycosyltransferase family 4 protein n=1 Tax=Thioclava sp. DLFJ5-1 TaxID=1915314 RepID=UPI0009985464|nr:glycosyltransferase family 4 protein [Thioclava sp. DLFJ5-1]OOY22038.1 glycosyltransferase WbuB [Thioclava sp. DLFJ5-1]